MYKTNPKVTANPKIKETIADFVNPATMYVTKEIPATVKA